MLAVHGGETGYGSLCSDSPWVTLRNQMYAPVECAVGVHSSVASPSPLIALRSLGPSGGVTAGVTVTVLENTPVVSPLVVCSWNWYVAPLTSNPAVHGLPGNGYGSRCML